LLAAEWSAGDVLNFYGALLASIATIVGVYLSINYAQRNYREDERNRIKPYLALTQIRAKSKYNFWETVFNGPNVTKEQEKEPEKIYMEFRLTRVYIIISKEKIEFKDGLTQSQQQLLNEGGFLWKGTEKGCSLELQKYLSLPFEVDNVGNGAAINFKLSLYKNDSSEHRATSIYTLKQGDKIYFHIFSELEDDALFGEYTLTFKYCDIQGTYYEQSYPLSILNESKGVCLEMDLTGTQKIVKEEQ
jgi:hypothetical protein